MIILAYRDLSDENLHGFALLDSNVELVLRENVIPGAFGAKPIYIRHLRTLHPRSGEEVLIISTTNQDLTDSDKNDLILSAIEFLLS